MSSPISSIAAWMEAVIKATTPRVRDGQGFVKASGGGPLQLQDPNGNKAQRVFQIQLQPILGVGEFVGPCYELHHEMSVVIRYMLDLWQGEEFDEIKLMSADDASLIATELPRPPLSSPWSDGGTWNITLLGHEELARNERFAGVWEQTLTFDVLYDANDTTRTFECFGIYASEALLTAEKGSSSWLGTGRNELRRLSDGTAYEWVDPSWAITVAGGLSPGDVPTYADLDAIEAATLAGEQVAYSTADTRLARVDASVARLLFDEGDVATYADTSAMEAATLYGDELGDIGGAVYQIQAGTATELTSAAAGLVTEHTTLASLYAEAGADGDRALLKTSAGVEVGIWRHDGTRWSLDGKLDTLAAAAEGAAMFAGYVSADPDVVVAWSASGLDLTGATATNKSVYLQVHSTPLEWIAEVNKLQMSTRFVFDGAAVAGRYCGVGAAWGVAGARDFSCTAPPQQITVTQKRLLVLYGSNAAPSIAASGNVSGNSASDWASVDIAPLDASRGSLHSSCRDEGTGLGTEKSVIALASVMGFVGRSVLDAQIRFFQPSNTKLSIESITVTTVLL